MLQEIQCPYLLIHLVILGNVPTQSPHDDHGQNTLITNETHANLASIQLKVLFTFVL